ncbi:MAG: hypothetical protein ACRDM7_05965 [Thermoleophilaceae bacterium]
MIETRALTKRYGDSIVAVRHAPAPGLTTPGSWDGAACDPRVPTERMNDSKADARGDDTMDALDNPVLPKSAGRDTKPSPRELVESARGKHEAEA